MPNWCVGVLKVRGNKDNLISFILEGLQPVNLYDEDLEALVLTNECIETNATCWIKATPERNLWN